MIELNKIYCEDCVSGMKKLDDDSVNIVVTSPPYNVGTDIGSGKKSKYEGYGDDLSDDEYYKLIKECIEQCIRVSRYSFINFQILSKNKKIYQQILWDFKDNIKEYFIWAKTYSQPSICEGVVSSGFEFIICFTKPEFAIKRKFDRCFWSNRKKGAKVVSNTLIYPPNQNHNKDHLACFPEWLPNFFIKNFTQEEDVVMDPFMGLGTTAKVAKIMGRKYVGFEISQNYIDKANKELEQVGLMNFI